MANTPSKRNLEETYKLIQLNLLYFSSGLIILGAVVDAITLQLDGHTIIVNIVTIVLVALCVGLYVLKKMPLNYSYGTVLYTAIANFLFSALFEIHTAFYANNFVLNALYFGLIISLIGFAIGKWHAVIVGGIFNVFFTIVLVYTKNEFLVSRAAMLYLLLSGYTLLIYYIISLMEQGYSAQIDLQKKINEKNKQITKANNILLKRENDLQKITSELFEKNKSLSELSTSKDKLFSVIGHDLKNHANSLNGFLSLLLERFEKLSLDKRQMYLQQASDSGKNLYALLNDLLEWTRNQSYKTKYNPSTINLQNLTNNVIYYIKLAADTKKISVQNHIPPNTHAYADYDMVFTILRNLVSNAIKFSHKYSEIDISVNFVIDKIRVHVIDRGVGISDEQQGKLFRIDTGMTTPGTNKERGTGLGLLICKDFVQKNNGEIGVISEKNKGSDFWFTVPLSNKN